MLARPIRPAHDIGLPNVRVPLSAELCREGLARAHGVRGSDSRGAVGPVGMQIMIVNTYNYRPIELALACPVGTVYRQAVVAAFSTEFRQGTHMRRYLLKYLLGGQGIVRSPALEFARAAHGHRVEMQG